jgi:prevent-host-death family protein
MTRVTNLTSTTDSDSTPGAWTIATAKARLSEVIDHARAHGPQMITRNGRPAAVVVGAEEWERRTQRAGTLAEFFAISPLREVPELSIERAPDVPRDDVV